MGIGMQRARQVQTFKRTHTHTHTHIHTHSRPQVAPPSLPPRKLKKTSTQKDLGVHVADMHRAFQVQSHPTWGGSTPWSMSGPSSGGTSHPSSSQELTDDPAFLYAKQSDNGVRLALIMCRAGQNYV